MLDMNSGSSWISSAFFSYLYITVFGWIIGISTCRRSFWSRRAEQVHTFWSCRVEQGRWGPWCRCSRTPTPMARCSSRYYALLCIILNIHTAPPCMPCQSFSTTNPGSCVSYSDFASAIAASWCGAAPCDCLHCIRWVSMLDVQLELRVHLQERCFILRI
jgi:hypothetical protein